MMNQDAEFISCAPRFHFPTRPASFTPFPVLFGFAMAGCAWPSALYMIIRLGRPRDKSEVMSIAWMWIALPWVLYS
jgi:hypothetical protein